MSLTFVKSLFCSTFKTDIVWCCRSRSFLNNIYTYNNTLVAPLPWFVDIMGYKCPKSAKKRKQILRNTSAQYSFNLLNIFMILCLILLPELKCFVLVYDDLTCGSICKLKVSYFQTKPHMSWLEPPDFFAELVSVRVTYDLLISCLTPASAFVSFIAFKTSSLVLCLVLLRALNQATASERFPVSYC